MPSGGAGMTSVGFPGPANTTVGEFSCPSVSGDGITGTEDLSKIGGICTFSPSSVTLPSQVMVTISGCTVQARLRTRAPIFASFFFGLPAIILLGSTRLTRHGKKTVLRIMAILLLATALLFGAGCGGGFGPLTPTGHYYVLVQGTGPGGVYSAVIPVTVVPLK